MSGAIQASSIAIVTDGLLTLNNTGLVTSGGSFAVLSNNGDVNVNQNVAGSTGTISAIAVGGIAIQAVNGTATVNNIGDGVTTGIITADNIAIVANAVNVTNTGLIQATGNNGVAIGGLADVTVNNFGIVSATGSNGVAIQAVNGTATVSNSGDGISTGIITANNDAIFGNAVNVTNTGLIQANGNGNTTIIARNDVTVNNFGLIENFGGTTIHAVNGNADVTNTGTIRSAGLNGFAIVTNGTATIDNTGDGITTGVISAGSSAIASERRRQSHRQHRPDRGQGRRPQCYRRGQHRGHHQCRQDPNKGRLVAPPFAVRPLSWPISLAAPSRVGLVASSPTGPSISPPMPASSKPRAGLGEAINTSGTAKVNNASTGKIRSNALKTISATVVDVTKRRHDRSHGREQPRHLRRAPTPP